MNNSLKISVTILLVLVAFLCLKNLQPVEKIINEGPTSNIRKNDFYAAGKFLSLKGQDVIHRSNTVPFSELDSSAALFITNSEIDISESDAYKYIEWIRSGGNLIWEFDNERESNLAKLISLNASFKEATTEPPIDLNALIKKSDAVNPPLESNRANKSLTPSEQVRHELTRIENKTKTSSLSTVYTDKATGPLRFLTDSGTSLEHPLLNQEQMRDFPDLQLDTSAENKTVISMLSFQLGKGHLTIISDADIWTNDKIGLFDHAHLLYWLNKDAKRIYIQRYANWPSLLELIIQYAFELTLASLLLLLAWSITKAKRFGPIRETNRFARRSMEEHITAVANFHYRHNQMNFLLQPLRTEIYQKALNHHSAFDQLSETNQFAVISEISNLPVEDIKTALSETEKYSDEQFTFITKLLINIRNAL